MSYLYNGNDYTWKDSLYIKTRHSCCHGNSRHDVDSLLQDCSNSIVNKLELSQS